MGKDGWYFFSPISGLSMTDQNVFLTVSQRYWVTEKTNLHSSTGLT